MYLARYDVAGRVDFILSRTLIGDGCWEWTGSKSREGYSIILTSRSRGGKRTVTSAHRFLYEAMRGKIPDGLVLDHLCRNRGCVNPDHLEPVTDGENTRRGEGVSSKNRDKTHCKHGHPFDEENTYHLAENRAWRACRTCVRAAGADWYRRVGRARRAAAKSQ